MSIQSPVEAIRKLRMCREPRDARACRSVVVINGHVYLHMARGGWWSQAFPRFNDKLFPLYSNCYRINDLLSALAQFGVITYEQYGEHMKAMHAARVEYQKQLDIQHYTELAAKLGMQKQA